MAGTLVRVIWYRLVIVTCLLFNVQLKCVTLLLVLNDLTGKGHAAFLKNAFSEKKQDV